MSEFELASKVSKEEVGGKKGKKAKTTAAPAVDTTPIVEQKPPANAAGLMSMFSDQGREKFARAFKPVEVEKKIIETPKEVAENQAELDERKQRKLEKRKINRMAEREAKAAAAGGESVVVKPAAAAAPVAAPIAVVDNKKGKETAKPAPAAVAAKPVATTSVAKPAAAKPAATTKPVPILPPTARSATIIPAPGSVVKSDDKNQKKRKAEEIAEDKPTTPEEEGATAADTEGVGAEVPSADLVDPKTNPRTLFIGNITIKFESKDIEKLFQPFGAVESIRLRSVPIAGTKVDEAGNQNLVKKVCVQKKLLGEQKGSLNAYLVFKEEESVGKAIKAMNNTVVEGRHLRVDRATPTLFDPKRSIFIGGLPYYADEEEVRTFFAEVSKLSLSLIVE